MKIEERQFVVTRVTPKGVRIATYWGPNKAGQIMPHDPTDITVCWHWNKRHAWPTREEALQSLIARKKRQHGIYTARAAQAERAQHIAENMLAKARGETKPYPFEAPFTI